MLVNPAATQTDRAGVGGRRHAEDAAAGAAEGEGGAGGHPARRRQVARGDRQVGGQRVGQVGEAEQRALGGCKEGLVARTGRIMKTIL